MSKRTKTNWIVLHCSATRGLQTNIGVDDIRRWHKAQGWKDVGYHFVIKRDGTLQTGRAQNTIGSHAKGHNYNSVGICLVGGLDDKTWKPVDNFTAAQWKTLTSLVGRLIKTYPAAKVLGHRDFPGVNKACPCFSAKIWAKKNGFPT
jgi:N-acetyl-anhydromuramyl-L-alanine amidase AmpD